MLRAYKRGWVDMGSRLAWSVEELDPDHPDPMNQRKNDPQRGLKEYTRKYNPTDNGDPHTAKTTGARIYCHKPLQLYIEP